MKIKTKIQVALGIVMYFIFNSTGLVAQQEKYLAAFIYQFTNYITWPSPSADFIIGVVGKTPVTVHLQQLAKEKKVGSSAIVINVSTISISSPATIPGSAYLCLSRFQSVIRNLLILHQPAQGQNLTLLYPPLIQKSLRHDYKQSCNYFYVKL